MVPSITQQSCGGAPIPLTLSTLLSLSKPLDFPCHRVGDAAENQAASESVKTREERERERERVARRLNLDFVTRCLLIPMNPARYASFPNY